MVIRAGQLDQRVELQQKSSTRALNGEEIVSWITVATVSAAVTQIGGREFFAAGQMQGTVDHRVNMRYRAGVTRDMRLLWRGAPLDIVLVTEKGRKSELELMCISGVRNGG